MRRTQLKISKVKGRPSRDLQHVAAVLPDQLTYPLPWLLDEK